MIKNKWKLFAMCHILADWDGNYVQIFDELTKADYKECKTIFDCFRVDVWEPFDKKSCDDVAELIWTMAHEAQKTDNLLEHEVN